MCASRSAGAAAVFTENKDKAPEKCFAPLMSLKNNLTTWRNKCGWTTFFLNLMV